MREQHRHMYTMYNKVCKTESRREATAQLREFSLVLCEGLEGEGGAGCRGRKREGL